MRKLTEGEVDLVITVAQFLPAQLRRQPLFDYNYRVVMGHGHPAADSFGLKPWLAYPHLVVSGHGVVATALDRQLAERGLTRRVGIVVPSFLVVPAALFGSDMIALLPRSCLPRDGQLFVDFPPPVPVEGFRVDLVWHERRTDHSMIRHVREVISEVQRPEMVG